MNNNYYFRSKLLLSGKKSESDEKNPYNPPKILSKKQFLSIFVVLILLASVLLVFAFNDTIFGPSQDDKKKNKQEDDNGVNNETTNNTYDKLNYDNPNITSIETASSVHASGYNPSNSFNQRDEIFVWLEYKNISHNGSVSAKIEFSVYNNNVVYNQGTSNIESSDSFHSTLSFLSDESWPIGEYEIQIKLIDEISNKNDTDSCIFNLYTYESSIPRLNINADPDNGFSPLEVDFTSSVENMTEPISYNWDFNDDDVIDSTIQNPDYIFSTVGNNKVTLEVNDSNDAALSSIIYIEVKPNIEASLSTSTLVGYPSLDVEFNITTKNFTEKPYVKWDFDGDNNYEKKGENLVDTSWTYSNVGVYNVTVIVSDDYTDLTLNCQVEVVESIDVNMSYSRVGSLLYLNGSATGGKGALEYLWEVRDGGSSGTLLYSSTDRVDTYEVEITGLIYVKFQVCDSVNCIYDYEYDMI